MCVALFEDGQRPWLLKRGLQGALRWFHCLGEEKQKAHAASVIAQMFNHLLTNGKSKGLPSVIFDIFLALTIAYHRVISSKQSPAVKVLIQEVRTVACEIKAAEHQLPAANVPKRLTFRHRQDLPFGVSAEDLCETLLFMQEQTSQYLCYLIDGCAAAVEKVWATTPQTLPQVEDPGWEDEEDESFWIQVKPTFLATPSSTPRTSPWATASQLETPRSTPQTLRETPRSTPRTPRATPRSAPRTPRATSSSCSSEEIVEVSSISEGSALRPLEEIVEVITVSEGNALRTRATPPNKVQEYI